MSLFLAANLVNVGRSAHILILSGPLFMLRGHVCFGMVMLIAFIAHVWGRDAFSHAYRSIHWEKIQEKFVIFSKNVE